MKYESPLVLLIWISCFYTHIAIANIVNVKAEAKAKAIAKVNLVTDTASVKDIWGCAAVEIPVCGLLEIEGQAIYKTFGNKCELSVANRLHPKEQYRQIGKENESCECLKLVNKCRLACFFNYDPVCGVRYNDKGITVYRTFGNPCDFWSTVCSKPNLRWEKFKHMPC